MIHFRPPELCIETDCRADLTKESQKHFSIRVNGKDTFRCHPCWLKNMRMLPVHVRGREGFNPWNSRAIEGPNPNPGNLENWQYRYWIGDKDIKSDLSICRCCRQHVVDKHERLKHSSKWNCWKKLEAAYCKLEKSGFCMICAKWTVGMCWGVMLCTPECTDKWKFLIKRWASLESLLITQGARKDIPIDGIPLL